MLSVLNELRDFNLYTVLFRIVLAAACGGLIGIERTFKRRTAGFRTHILICLGAAMTTLTSQFLLLEMHSFTDVARLAAQVISGVGFIGAGTIIVTRRQKVHGLTTAAGLWAAAIVGLSIGAGFYEGGLMATVLILISEVVFSRLEYWLVSRVPEVNLYVEYTGRECLESILALCRAQDWKLLDMEILSRTKDEKKTSGVFFELRLDKHSKRGDIEDAVARLKKLPGIEVVMEL